MRRLLIVDDNPADFALLDGLFRTISPTTDITWVKHGLEAIEYLKHGSRPDLILMDLNMPLSDGLNTTSVLKADPELCVIPIVMLSSDANPSQVRKAYQSHVNGFVLKPTSLADGQRLVQAIVNFWEQAIVSPSAKSPIGMPLASAMREASGTAEVENSWKYRTEGDARFCQEQRDFLEEFSLAIGEVLTLNEQQFRAIVEGDTDFNRFDLLIHMANEKKQKAKYDYLRHVEVHRCSKPNVTDLTRTRSS